MKIQLSEDEYWPFYWIRNAPYSFDSDKFPSITSLNEKEILEAEDRAREDNGDFEKHARDMPNDKAQWVLKVQEEFRAVQNYLRSMEYDVSTGACLADKTYYFDCAN